MMREMLICQHAAIVEEKKMGFAASDRRAMKKKVFERKKEEWSLWVNVKRRTDDQVGLEVRGKGFFEVRIGEIFRKLLKNGQLL